MSASLNLKSRAHRAAIEAGFHPDFPPEVLREVQQLTVAAPDIVPGTASTDLEENRTGALRSDLPPGNAPLDLRSLLWSSIDNEDSRDLDQVEYVEELQDGIRRLLVGIADVDGLVPRGSATDRQAGAEATSIYTGVETFPMLPSELSTHLSSLVAAEDRRALVIEVRIGGSGEVLGKDLYPGWIRNHAKLAYGSVGAWLEGRGAIPSAVAAVPGMEQQLRLQFQLCELLKGIRKEHGALTFGGSEPTAMIENGEVRGLSIREHNPAEDIIESFMVAANVAMAQMLRGKHRLCLRRVVRTPRRWDRIREIAASLGVTLPATPDNRALSNFLAERQASDPLHFPDLSLSIVKLLGPGEYVVETPGLEKEAHFGLAVTDYTHSTAPNRRYADLVTQRLLKAAADQSPEPYSLPDLGAIAAHCTEREDAARKVERLMRKVLAASFLSGRIGESFEGIITGAGPKGTYVRLFKFPAEGKLVHGSEGLDVGDRVKVRLVGVDLDKGFIDFQRLGQGA